MFEFLVRRPLPRRGHDVKPGKILIFSKKNGKTVNCRYSAC